MGRIRTIKPEFFLHEDLFDLEQESKLPVRLAFAGLWTQADREGRFKWHPRKLKSQILPYDNCDFSRVLHALTTRGFVLKYASNGAHFGFIPSFLTHQNVNNRESASSLPDPDASDCEIITSTRAPRVPHAYTESLNLAQGERKGKEWKGKEQEGEDCTETQSVSVPAVPLLTFPTDGTPKQWDFCKALLDTLSEAYPHLDVLAEVKQALAWIRTNPDKQKTARGMPAFLNRWCTRAQNSGRSPRTTSRQTNLTVADIFGDDQ